MGAVLCCFESALIHTFNGCRRLRVAETRVVRWQLLLYSGMTVCRHSAACFWAGEQPLLNILHGFCCNGALGGEEAPSAANFRQEASSHVAE